MRVGMQEVSRLMTAMVAAATLAACSGGDDGGTNPTPAISIALSSATLSVVQGATGTVNLTLTRTGGFTGDVSIAVEGLPTGVTSTVAPPSLGSAVSAAVITIGAGGTATPGVISATVRATGTGVTAQTAALAITVTAAPTPSFTLALAPTTLSVAQGANGTSAVTLTRAGGFTGAVALTAENLPTGVTAAFNPASVTGTTSTLTLTVAATAAAATTTITVRGTGTGVTAQTATLALTVTAPTAGSFTLAVTEATVTATQGGTGTANITLTRTGGFTGAVALTAENLPTGVTAAFNPASVTGTTSVLTLTVAANAPAASASMLVRGTSAGQTGQVRNVPIHGQRSPGRWVHVGHGTDNADRSAGREWHVDGEHHTDERIRRHREPHGDGSA